MNEAKREALIVASTFARMFADALDGEILAGEPLGVLSAATDYAHDQLERAMQYLEVVRQ